MRLGQLFITDDKTQDKFSIYLFVTSARNMQMNDMDAIDLCVVALIILLEV